MGAAFGERWHRNYGPVWETKRERQRKRRPHLWPRLGRVARIWERYLGELKPEALERAVERAEKRTDPPTLPEFVALARGGEGQIERRTAPPPHPLHEETAEQRALRLRAGQAVLDQLRTLLQ